VIFRLCRYPRYWRRSPRDQFRVGVGWKTPPRPTPVELLAIPVHRIDREEVVEEDVPAGQAVGSLPSSLARDAYEDVEATRYSDQQFPSVCIISIHLLDVGRAEETLSRSQTLPLSPIQVTPSYSKDVAKRGATRSAVSCVSDHLVCRIRSEQASTVEGSEDREHGSNAKVKEARQQLDAEDGGTEESGCSEEAGEVRAMA